MKGRIQQLTFYTVPSFFSKATSLLLVPLYVTNLSVIDFGALELILLFGTFLQYAFHFGWGSGYVRFYNESGINFRDLVTTLLYFRLAIATLLVIIFFISSDNILYILNLDKNFYLAISFMIAIYFLREFNLFFETKYRVEEKAKSFMWMNIGISLLQLIAIPLFLLVFDFGVEGIILGQVVSLLIVFLIIFPLNFSWLTSGDYDFALLKRVLSFGLPLMPTALAMFIMTAADRYMLVWLSIDENGIYQVAYYSLAYKIVFIMTLITSGFSIFWGSYVYSTYTEKNAKHKYGFIYRNYIGVVFMGSIFLLLFLPWLYTWFEEYRQGLVLVPILLAGFIVYQIGDYFCIGIGIKNKNVIRAYSGIVATAFNISLNYLLIPIYGSLGASIATLSSFIVYSLILMYRSHQLYPVNYSWLLLIIATTSVLGTSLIYLFAEMHLLTYLFVVMIIVSILYVNAGGFKREWLDYE